MHFLVSTTALLCLASSAIASVNTTREYYLKTELKAGQPDKARFNDLYMESYHTGAGESDPTFSTSRTYAVKGFLNATSTKRLNGQHFNDQEFDFGNDFPWGLEVVPTANFYSAWEPVRINAGAKQDGYFINGTGLQWNSQPTAPAENEFGGWIVCQWWHQTPQLFMKWANYPNTLPCSCAHVLLIAEYIY